jgi:acetoin utilization deacetylase AcuC-like enzyme
LSDSDIRLPVGKDDESHLEVLLDDLETVIRDTNADMVALLAGVDPYQCNIFGRPLLSMARLVERDRIGLQGCHDAELPAAIVPSGGNAHKIEDTVDVRPNTMQIAAEVSGQIKSKRYCPSPIIFSESRLTQS